jgi:D-glycero-D-manno-heptose 1,7-bisphosphate phosphatase
MDRDLRAFVELCRSKKKGQMSEARAPVRALHRTMTERASAMRSFCVDDQGVWSEVLRSPRTSARRPAVFFDRDGVIVEEVGHLQRAEDVRLIAGAASVISAANRAGIPVVVVSNQSGIGRGLFGWQDFGAVQQRMLEMLQEEGALIDAVLACPHHADAEPPYRHPDHPSRKPNAGMILAASRLLPVDLAASWIIGDRATDLSAGRNAGLGGGLLVLTGCGDRLGELEAAQRLAGASFRVFAGPSVAAALTLIPLLDQSCASELPADGEGSAQARP